MLPALSLMHDVGGACGIFPQGLRRSAVKGSCKWEHCTSSVHVQQTVEHGFPGDQVDKRLIRRMTQLWFLGLPPSTPASCGRHIHNLPWLRARIGRVLWLLPLLDPIVEQLCGPQLSESHLQRLCPSHPPFGFRRAVGLPCRIVSTIDGGTSALANLSPRRNIECSADGWSKSGRRCSTVIPEGPAANASPS